MAGRQVLKIGGSEREAFLQGLVTNDVSRASDGIVYAALLTPQGKYLADFFIHETGAHMLLDADAEQAPALARRLAMYKLRADVTIEAADTQVRRGTGPMPAGALADPRHPDLGWRAYGPDTGDDGTNWDAIRVAHCIPETGIELIPDATYPLEAGFERLDGVDFRKGCYVGQEVTARMKHKTELRKGFATVAVTGAAPVGTVIESGGKSVGTLFTQSGESAIAYLRFDRVAEGMTAGDAQVTYPA
ncbi:MAG: folate-binding protein [Pseudomonadota bacterium]